MVSVPSAFAVPGATVPPTLLTHVPPGPVIIPVPSSSPPLM
jgi:hypothetical protein